MIVDKQKSRWYGIQLSAQSITTIEADLVNFQPPMITFWMGERMVGQWNLMNIQGWSELHGISMKSGDGSETPS